MVVFLDLCFCFLFVPAPVVAVAFVELLVQLLCLGPKSLGCCQNLCHSRIKTEWLHSQSTTTFPFFFVWKQSWSMQKRTADNTNQTGPFQRNPNIKSYQKIKLNSRINQSSNYIEYWSRVYVLSLIWRTNLLIPSCSFWRTAPTFAVLPLISFDLVCLLQLCREVINIKWLHSGDHTWLKLTLQLKFTCHNCWFQIN